jgi:hypothetical protein
MGEAKRREQLGPTRSVRVSKYELTDLVNFVAGPPGEQGPKIDQVARRRLRSALRQVGALEMWDLARRGLLTPDYIAKIPETTVKVLTVDAINELLSKIALMDNRTSLNLGDFEERLEDAKRGSYDPDEDAPPAGEAGQLAAVPDSDGQWSPAEPK